MKSLYVLLLLGAVALTGNFARGQVPPAVDGYVTRAVSATDFAQTGFAFIAETKP